ncbi:putative protein ABIL2 [Hibiscus syriacus]|uniref:Protein ABIL3 n=1 Tax=Hibiscus syriacus TaxID=106335 RepID=A0A6A2YPZ7_HIBSY|nr:putative protein ABIL2 [Hibiscus syriacus]
MPMSGEESDYEEVSMQQGLLFSESLKDLKKLRTQLYSATEYFELSYTNDDQKQIVVETLKDYAAKAIVNTIDHLGSVTYKVNDFLEEKVDEVSGTERRVSCVEELREYENAKNILTMKEFPNSRRLLKHRSTIKVTCCQAITRLYSVLFAFFHFVAITGKEYLAVFNVFDQIPVGETLHGANQTKSKYQGCCLDSEDNCHRFRSGKHHRRNLSGKPRHLHVKITITFLRSTTFSFTATPPKKELEKRTVSPHRFPRLSYGSASRPITLNKSRSTTPNSAGARQRYPSEPRKSAVDSEKDNTKDIEQIPTKSKRLRAFFGRRKSMKDDMLYTYLDEY